MRSRFPAWMRMIGRAIVDWWDSWTDNLLMGTVWLLCQITVILGPPATFGVYYVAHEQINGQGLGIPGMIHGARKHFGISLLWGLMNIVVLGVEVIAYDFYGSIQSALGMYLQGVIIVIAIAWVVTQFYALPYYFMMDPHNLWIAMRNGGLTALASPFFALAMLLFTIVDLVLSFALILPVFLGVPIIVPYLGFRAVTNRLETYGLREREKTPQEIEAEMRGRISTENINPIGRADVVEKDKKD